MTTLRSTYPRLTRTVSRPIATLSGIGDHMLFYLRAIGGVPPAPAVHFRREIIRLIAEISMGAGTLAMIGGTVVIVGFLTLVAPAGRCPRAGESSLGNIGIEVGTGFLAAFINVRISAPVVAGIGLAATFGAGYRAAGRDADQRGDRRAGIDGDPAGGISRQYPDCCGDDRDHPVVLDRCHPVVRRQPVHHSGAVRPVRWAV